MRHVHIRLKDSARLHTFVSNYLRPLYPVLDGLRVVVDVFEVVVGGC